MTERSLDLIGLGECMVELWSDDALSRAQTMHKAFGGDVLNALLTAARLGSKTGFVTRVGDDPFGLSLLQAWRTEGIDTTHASLIDGINGIYFVSVQANGEREFSYRRAGSAASTLTPSDLNPAYVTSARILLLSGITQALSVSAQAATLAAARIAKEAGTLIAYDANYRPRLWADRAGSPEAGLASAQTALRELLSLVDVALPSLPDDLPMFGEHDSIESKARSLTTLGPRMVAFKAGADGAWIFENDRLVQVAADPVFKLVDTTGAGDAWNGAFLHVLAQGGSTLEAARQANRIAARKLAYRGAIPPRDTLHLCEANPIAELAVE
jgi:2-dehydro-3-deoxygluconokinase